MSYAKGTSVTADRTIEEVKGLLRRRGCDRIATFEEPRRFVIAFESEGVAYRLGITLPDPSDDTFWYHSRGRRSDQSAADHYRQECNRRMRSLSLYLKATLVAVEDGIIDLRAALFGNIMLAGGQTVAERHAEDLSMQIASGGLASLALPG